MNPNASINYIIENSGKFAEAKANRVHIEEFRKSKKALLMKQSKEKSSVAQERDAYAHDEYIALLEGLKAAVEEEERLKWMITSAQMSVEVWRTLEASNRRQDKNLS